MQAVGGGMGVRVRGKSAMRKGRMEMRQECQRARASGGAERTGKSFF